MRQTGAEIELIGWYILLQKVREREGESPEQAKKEEKEEVEQAVHVADDGVLIKCSHAQLNSRRVGWTCELLHGAIEFGTVASRQANVGHKFVQSPLQIYGRAAVGRAVCAALHCLGPLESRLLKAKLPLHTCDAHTLTHIHIRTTTRTRKHKWQVICA